MFIELAGIAAEAAVGAAYENRNAVLQWGKDFYRRVKDGHHLIVLFGAGGAGKTTTGQILSGSSELNDLTGAYNLSTTMEEVGLRGRFFVNMKIPPGQEAYRSMWSDLVREMIDSKRAPILINVVCWGMHSPARLELASIPEFSTGISPESVEQYCQNRRALEVQLLETVARHANLLTAKLSMITLVTKQDLWWPQRNAVRDFYENPNGGYQANIDMLRKSLGENNFSHQTWSLSYGHFNHSTVDGHQIFSTAGGYDDNIQNAHLKRFAGMIDGLCK